MNALQFLNAHRDDFTTHDFEVYQDLATADALRADTTIERRDDGSTVLHITPTPAGPSDAA